MGQSLWLVYRKSYVVSVQHSQFTHSVALLRQPEIRTRVRSITRPELFRIDLLFWTTRLPWGNLLGRGCWSSRSKVETLQSHHKQKTPRPQFDTEHIFDDRDSCFDAFFSLVCSCLSLF